MAICLGVDTGGTFTDAVLVADNTHVLASAKALTSRPDLAIGIGQAMRQVLAAGNVLAADVKLVSLSTTLATNALVEGQGAAVALVVIGFDAGDLGRAGLAEAMQGDPVISLAGGHDHAGNPTAQLDLDALQQALTRVDATVAAYAVAARFATRNPAHELAARAVIRQATGKPVTCSHELSSKLNGPKRALTAVLNARLIPLLDQLVIAADGLTKELGISAPLMVVRGDGALISSDLVREKPIETILSGPAASIVGAAWLTGTRDAVVSDIGGTTTDVAIIRDGQPGIDPDGARVGPHRTMVEAVAVRTAGLGGDSEVSMAEDGLRASLTLGPRRVVPVSLLAVDAPEQVHAALDAALQRERTGEYDGCFVWLLHAGAPTAHLSPRELALVERCVGAIRPLAEVVKTRTDMPLVRKLVSRGVLRLAGLTPSDACHVLGLQDVWDGFAAEKAARLFARRITNGGLPLAPDARALSERIVQTVRTRTAECLMATALAEDGFEQPEQLARHPLVARGMAQAGGAARVNIGLSLPVIGLGASAHTYYPALAGPLGCSVHVPEHGGVANAIGAVVGQVQVSVSLSITSPADGQFVLHLPSQPRTLTQPDAALAAARDWLTAEAVARAHAAGAAEARVTIEESVSSATIEGRAVMIGAELTARATGRPRL